MNVPPDRQAWLNEPASRAELYTLIANTLTVTVQLAAAVAKSNGGDREDSAERLKEVVSQSEKILLGLRDKIGGVGADE